jgi:hypothetical protein
MPARRSLCQAFRASRREGQWYPGLLRLRWSLAAETAGLGPAREVPMSTTTTSSALVPARPVFAEPERLALAGYSGLTREAYALDLRQFAVWCQLHHLALFAARRADIECFGRDLEAAGRARATVTRRLSTIAGFYRYAVEEDPSSSLPPGHGWTGTARADRPPHRPQSEPCQEDRPAHSAPRVHHRRPRRRRATARRAGSCLARRSENHHEVRPRAGLPGPARHIYRRPLTLQLARARLAATAARRPTIKPSWPYAHAP